MCLCTDLFLQWFVSVRLGFHFIGVAGGLFIGWLRMDWGVLHTLVLVAVLVSVFSLSG